MFLRQMKEYANRNPDLAILVLTTAVLSFVIGCLPGLTAVRAPLAIVFLILVPGYGLVSAMLPRREPLDLTERIGVGIGASVALVALTGLTLNYSPWGVTWLNTFVVLALFTLAASAYAAWRRERVGSSDAFRVPCRLPVVYLERTGFAGWLSLAFLGAVLVGILAYVAVTIMSPRPSAPGTALYVVDSSGRTVGLPRIMTAGQPVEVLVGIANPEEVDLTYRLEIRIADEVDQVIDSIAMSAGETRELPVEFSIDEPAETEKVSFLLYRPDDTSPFRAVHFWPTVESGR